MDRFSSRRDDDDDDGQNSVVSTDNPLHNLVSIADYTESRREAFLKAEMAQGRFVTLWIAYNPELISDATDQRIMDLAESGDRLAAARVFCEIVYDWNLAGPYHALVTEYDDDGEVSYDITGNPITRTKEIVPPGQKFPLDPEFIKYLSSQKFISIWTALREDAMGVPTSRRDRRRQARQSRRQSPPR